MMMVALEETFTGECKTFNCVEIETIHRHVARHVRLSWHGGLTLSLLSWKCVARTVCRVGRDRWRPSPGPGPAPSPALDPSLDTT